MVNVIDAFNGLSRASQYEAEDSVDLITDYFTLGGYSYFDCSGRVGSVLAGYSIDGFPVRFLGSLIDIKNSYLLSEVDLYFNNIVEIPRETNSVIKQNYMMQYFTQEEKETEIKANISETNLYRRPYYIGGNGFTEVNFGASVSQNYEQFLKVLNSTRYKNVNSYISGGSTGYEIYKTFTTYDTSGDVVDSGTDVLIESGSGLPSTSKIIASYDIDYYTNPFEDQVSSEEERYTYITVYPDIFSGDMVKNFHLVCNRGQFTEGVESLFYESLNVKFDMTGVFDSQKVEVDPSFKNPPVGEDYVVSYKRQGRDSIEHIEFTDINHVMELTGVSTPP